MISENWRRLRRFVCCVVGHKWARWESGDCDCERCGDEKFLVEGEHWLKWRWDAFTLSVGGLWGSLMCRLGRHSRHDFYNGFGAQCVRCFDPADEKRKAGGK